MRHFRNDQGIALVTALMMTLISMVIVMAVLYLVTAGTRVSASHKRYMTALEATYGGAEFVSKDLIPQLFAKGASPFVVTLQGAYAGISLQFPNADVAAKEACLRDKLNKGTSNWGNCSAASKSLDPGVEPDVKFTLAGLAMQPGFAVFAKIVDSIPGNTDTSGAGAKDPSGDGGTMINGGVVWGSMTSKGDSGGSSAAGVFTPMSIPFIYRIEMIGQKETRPVERPNISVIYAY